jgi:hypothetical protein
MPSSSRRIGALHLPLKRKKYVSDSTQPSYGGDDLDDLILENVLRQILNSSYHRRRLHFQPHLQYPQVKRRVINKIKIPPQFPHSRLEQKIHGSIDKEHVQENAKGFRVKNYISKIGYGNGVEFQKPSIVIKQHNNIPLLESTQNLKSNLQQESLNFTPKDSMRNYVTNRLIEIGLNQVNSLAFDGNRQDEKLAETFSNAAINDIPNRVTPDLSDIHHISHLIKRWNKYGQTAATRRRPMPHSKYNQNLSSSTKYDTHKTNNNEFPDSPYYFDNKVSSNIVFDTPTTISQSEPIEKEETPTQQSSLLNRLTTEGLKFVLGHVNNLVFDGKRQDEKLAEIISTAIIHDIPNLLTPQLPEIPNIFLGPFGSSKDTEKVDNTDKIHDLKSSASDIVTNSSIQKPEENKLRYVFLLGVVPAVVGSFLAIGAQPLQAMLVGAYVVTTYLFFVEKNWSIQRSQRKILSDGDFSNDIDDIDLIFSKAINRFLNVTKNLSFRDDTLYNSHNTDNSKNKLDIGDLMIHKYFNYSDQLRPLLALMDDQTISYVKTFDDIMNEVLQSIHQFTVV